MVGGGGVIDEGKKKRKDSEEEERRRKFCRYGAETGSGDAQLLYCIYCSWVGSRWVSGRWVDDTPHASSAQNYCWSTSYGRFAEV